MSNSKKLLITALAVIFLVGAGPVFAQFGGFWAGTGTGCCHPESTTITIYPWQRWGGFVEYDERFHGEWEDSLGHQGTFEGRVVQIDSIYAVFEGTWEWTFFTPPVYPPIIPPVIGEFHMDFDRLTYTCRGEWFYHEDYGTMQGQRLVTE